MQALRRPKSLHNGSPRRYKLRSAYKTSAKIQLNCTSAKKLRRGTG